MYDLAVAKRPGISFDLVEFLGDLSFDPPFPDGVIPPECCSGIEGHWTEEEFYGEMPRGLVLPVSPVKIRDLEFDPERLRVTSCCPFEYGGYHLVPEAGQTPDSAKIFFEYSIFVLIFHHLIQSDAGKEIEIDNVLFSIDSALEMTSDGDFAAILVLCLHEMSRQRLDDWSESSDIFVRQCLHSFRNNQHLLPSARPLYPWQKDER